MYTKKLKRTITQKEGPEVESRFDEMRVSTGQTLPEMLEELYLHYYREAMKIYQKMPDEEPEDWGKLQKQLAEERDTAYQAGRADGAVDALGAVLLQVIGSRRMFGLWQKAMSEEK